MRCAYPTYNTGVYLFGYSWEFMSDALRLSDLFILGRINIDYRPHKYRIFT